jgi:hypothetical protein
VKWIAVLWVAAAIGAVAMCADDAHAQSQGLCRRTGFRVDNAVRTLNESITVGQNGRCGSQLAGVQFDAPRVDSSPAHGRVEFNGVNYAYVPDPGFTGADRFVVSWLNQRNNVRVSLTVHVAVEPAGTRTAAAAPALTAPCRYMANGPITDQMRYGAGTMVVGRGRTCRVTLNGFTVSGVESAPANGRVETNGGHYDYVPNQNFTGSDSFSVNYNVQGRRVINVVNVQVVPQQVRNVVTIDVR